MKFFSKHALMAAAILAGTSVAAHAAPLVDVTILGSTDGVNYSSSLTVTPGETVYLEVTDVLAGAGTSNSTNGYTTTTQVAGTNGSGSFGSLAFTDASGASLTGALTNEWQAGLGSTQGSQTGTTITFNALLATGAAYVGALSPDVLATGSFIAGSSASDTITGATANFNAKIDTTTGQKNLVAKANTGTDPYVGFTPLTLTESDATAVPAPNMAFGFGGLALCTGVVALKRRGRQIA